MTAPLQIVWFKRDLRIIDHEALFRARERGPVLPLYILEPELWQQPDLSRRHYTFLKECIQELNTNLEKTIGQNLILRTGDACNIFEDLLSRYPVQSVWSHQETWNGWTYARDQAVQRLLQKAAVPWRQPRQFGIVRCLRNRDGWSRQWNQLMALPTYPAPKKQDRLQIDSEALPSADRLGLAPDAIQTPQIGGRSHGLKLLRSFLTERGEPYTKAMSAPDPAFEHCSRLSTHIAFGTVSVREIYKAYQARSQEIRALPRDSKGQWPSALRSFGGRLRWHCHFMQKLEDEPRVEFENFHSAYNGLRERQQDQDHFDAWAEGRTGYPMVDACMRALIATGWINFRMRAMLISFASYHLWLHWRPTSLHLARLFTDYEPGIHYTQCQMQSGTTGINTVRIYNPIKQGIDHDPNGSFIRKWIPELQDVPDSGIHQPCAFPDQLNGYPLPIVDETTARKAAAAKIYTLRKGRHYRNEAEAIVNKHGSRKSSERSKLAVARKTSQQVELPIS